MTMPSPASPVPVPARYDVRPIADKWAVFDTFTQAPVAGRAYTLKSHAIEATAAHNRAYNAAMRDA